MTMSKKTYEIGDTIEWSDVPIGALVRRNRDDGGLSYYLRCGVRGWCVGYSHPTAIAHWEPFQNGWVWNYGLDPDCEVTIIAMDLTGSESADDLRRLAEVFEVRKTLNVRPMMMIGRLGVYVQVQRVWWQDGVTADELRSLIAERLHAAGWRPGDSAERAAELLAGGTR